MKKLEMSRLVLYPLHTIFIHAAIRYCDAEITSTENNMITYSWPRSLAGERATLVCPTRPKVLVMRNCSSEGVWQTVSDDGCDSVSEQLDMLNPSFANVSVILALHAS